MNDEAKAMDAGHHPIRRVGVRESPWEGLLAQDADGALRLLVDADTYRDSAGWNADPDGHVLAPLDVARRADGHDVVLPACADRLDALLVRRRDRRVPLSAGERVTVAVSVIRGLCEAHECAPDAVGSWWLTAEGRPVLALDAGEATDAASVASARLLTQLAAGADGRLAGILARAAARAEQPRALLREAPEIEADLFACAAPEPLATAGALPAAAGVLSPGFSQADVGEAEDPALAREGWLARIAPLVDADLADAASRAATSVWRRFHRRGDARAADARRPKRGPLMLAGGAAAAVVGLGLLWPAGGASPAVAGAQSETARQSPAVTRTAVEPEESGSPAPDPTAPPADEAPDATKAPAADETTAASPDAELLQTIDGLLTRRNSCGNDAACLRSVQEDPQRRFAEGATALPTNSRRVSLLDSFGGAAVAKVENANASAAGAADAQLVVVVRDGDRWLLRDVYGAQQPG